LSNKTILFADDSATMRHIAENTFAAEPYSVISAPSGEGAIAKAKETRPDIIIVDAGMPGFSGYDVCKAVRKEATLRTTPVIIMSGVSSLYDEAKGKEAGITEHMKKPFDTGLLIEMVQNLIQAAAAAEEDQLQFVDHQEELDSLSDVPMPEPDLERLSEPPIPLASPVMRYQSESVSRLETPIDLKPVGKETQDYARPSSPPAPPVTVLVSAPPVELEEEEEVFGEPADFGEEQADEAEPSDVPPLEFDTRDTEDHSGSFHVGTLAELAQMDARGVPIESELHDDAIELESSASSLASLGPRIAPKSQDIPDIEEEYSLDSIPAIPDIDETPE
jgi:DNA-binding response OmpR family regulator